MMRRYLFHGQLLSVKEIANAINETINYVYAQIKVRAAMPGDDLSALTKRNYIPPRQIYRYGQLTMPLGEIAKYSGISYDVLVQRIGLCGVKPGQDIYDLVTKRSFAPVVYVPVDEKKSSSPEPNNCDVVSDDEAHSLCAVLSGKRQIAENSLTWEPYYPPNLQMTDVSSTDDAAMNRSIVFEQPACAQTYSFRGSTIDVESLSAQLDIPIALIGFAIEKAGIAPGGDVSRIIDKLALQFAR